MIKPHYKNSPISMNNFEPVYKSVFEVIITPPDAVNNGWEYVMENITSISGLNVDKGAGADVQQFYRGAARSFSSANPSGTTLDIAINTQINVSEDNQWLSYNCYREWCFLIWNPLTGERTLKKDYIGGPMTVIIYKRDGLTQIREYVMPTIFPNGDPDSSGLDLDYSNGSDIHSFTQNYRADYWDDIMK